MASSSSSQKVKDIVYEHHMQEETVVHKEVHSSLVQLQTIAAKTEVQTLELKRNVLPQKRTDHRIKTLAYLNKQFVQDEKITTLLLKAVNTGSKNFSKKRGQVLEIINRIDG